MRYPQRTENVTVESSRPNIVGLHYRVGKKIGEGSFGVICEGIPHITFYQPIRCGWSYTHFCPARNNRDFLGFNIMANHPVAIKFEVKTAEAPQLRDEYKSYRILSGLGTVLLIDYLVRDRGNT